MCSVLWYSFKNNDCIQVNTYYNISVFCFSCIIFLVNNFSLLTYILLGFIVIQRILINVMETLIDVVKDVIIKHI